MLNTQLKLRTKAFQVQKTELILRLHNLNSVRLLHSSTFILLQGLIKQFLKDTFWGRLDFLIFGKLQRCTIEVLFNFITMTTIDGFHVTSTSPCWWTEKKEKKKFLISSFCINLPPEHPIMSSETIEIKMAAISAKRSISFDSVIQYGCWSRE